MKWSFLDSNTQNASQLVNDLLCLWGVVGTLVVCFSVFGILLRVWEILSMYNYFNIINEVFFFTRFVLKLVILEWCNLMSNVMKQLVLNFFLKNSISGGYTSVQWTCKIILDILNQHGSMCKGLGLNRVFQFPSYIC